jgi:PhzF family phenazine biosynthesis protein
MTLRIRVVDAFAEQAFGGNPAAVCVLPAARDASWMQHVAREMNLSETAFLVATGEAEFDLRWFTPSVEVALCGHATLASAHVVWTDGLAPADATLRFATKSGVLSTVQRAGRIEMDFPATPATRVEPPAGLLAALGIGSARWVGRTQFDYLVELDAESDVRALAPDARALRALAVRGVMVTARAARETWDFVSRFFAPGAGVDEDPVTGSAHCCLGPYWRERLGRDALIGRQLSARGGTVLVRVSGDGARVVLGGTAVTVLRGDLLV